MSPEVDAGFNVLDDAGRSEPDLEKNETSGGGSLPKNPAAAQRMEELLGFAFKREVTRRVTDVVVPLNDAGAGMPFYCIHGILGGATGFRDMVRMLGPNQNCYGVQVPTEKRTARFARSIKELGKHHASELVKFQPQGPFVLGGFSIGATIALEISQQLIAMGRKVSLLVVFDGELCNTDGELGSTNPLYWLRVMCNLPRWIGDELIEQRRLFQTVRRLRSFGFKTLRSQPMHPVERIINLKGVAPEHASFIKTLYDTHLAYVPEKYPGRVLVFVAKTQPLLHLRQVKAAWTTIARDSEIVRVDGTHISIMHAPHGLPVARRLKTEIEGAARSAC
jgi:thioesterase domain-containing protein